MKKKLLILLTVGVLSVFAGCDKKEGTKEVDTIEKPEITATVAPTKEPENTTKPVEPNSEITTTTEPDVEVDDDLSLMQKALLNKEKVKLVTGEEKQYLNDILKIDSYGEEEKENSKKYDFFYYVDMDGNGTKEVALSTTYLGGDILIFFEIEGEIYAQEWPYRGMKPLYNDGVMEGSNGAGDHVISKVTEITKEGVKEELIVNIITDDYSQEDVGARYYTKYSEEGEITYDEYVELMKSYSFNLNFNMRDKEYEAEEYYFSEAVIKRVLKEGKNRFTYEVNMTGEEENIKWDIAIKREKDNFSQDIVLMNEDATYLPNTDEMIKIEDVNFDGYDDILILKGYFGAQAAEIYETYIWDDETKKLVLNEVFGTILNPEIDYEKNLIIGDHREDSATHVLPVYRYEDDEFVNVGIITETFADGEDISVSVKSLVNGKWHEKVYGTFSDYKKYEEKYEEILESFMS